MKKYFLVLLIILISYSLLSAAEKSKAPDFLQRDINGKTVKLSELTQKGPVLIDFWALWCVPCLKELPHLNKIYQKFQEQGLTVLTVNEDDPSSESKVKPFVRSRGFKFMVIIDKDKELWRKYKVVSLPTLFLIDKDGNIHKHQVGYRPGDEKLLEADIAELLSETPKSNVREQ